LEGLVIRLTAAARIGATIARHESSDFSASLLALGAGVPLAAQAAAPISIRIGTQPIDSSAQALYAVDRDFFTKAGLAADLQVMNNGGAIVAAVAGGSLDVGFSNLFSFLPAFSHGIAASVVAPAALSIATSPVEALIVRKEAPFHSGKDLNGKTVAVIGLKSITHITAELFIDADGGDSSSVKYLELSSTEMGPALLQGRMDAATIAFSDFPDAGTPDSPFRILGYPYNAIAARFLASCWIANSTWMKTQPDALRRFQAAILESARWANGNQPGSAAVLMKYSKMTAEQMQKFATHRVVYGESLDPQLVRPVIATAAKYGVIPAAFPAQDLFHAG
jgi:NitT/TauT family transport system substrate-binding protein